MISDLFKQGHKFLIKVILIGLALTFVFGFGFGMSDFGSVSRSVQGMAVEINGETVSLNEFYRERDLELNKYRQAGYPEDAININFLNVQVLANLIELKLMAQEAKKLGLRVSNEELREAIVSDNSLQVNGKFIGADAYRNAVQAYLNISVAEFERRLRERLLAAKLAKLINVSSKISDEELLNIFKMRNEKASITFIEILPETFESLYVPTDDDVQKYYSEHLDEYLSAPLRKIKYLVLDESYLNSKVTVSEEEVKAYYDANPEVFTGDGKISDNSEADFPTGIGDIISAKMSDAKEVREKEPETKSTDGNTDDTTQGIASENGLKDFEDVKEKIKNKLVAQRSNQFKTQFLDNASEIIKDKSFEVLGQEFGSEVKISQAFAKNEFSDIPDGINKQSFVTPKGRIVVTDAGNDIWIFEINEVIEPSRMNVEDVRDRIEADLIQNKSLEFAKQKGQEALNMLTNAGKTLEELADIMKVELKETGLFTRVGLISKLPSQEIKIDAFSLTPENPASNKLYEFENGFYLISLIEKKEAELEEYQDIKSELRKTELYQRKNTLFLDWIKKLRAGAKITMNDSLVTPQG